jgi:hypothetical protein
MLTLKPASNSRSILRAVLNHLPQPELCNDRNCPTDSSCLAASWGTDVK